MTLFCDLPGEQRMALRDAIEAAGGIVDGYDGPNVRVALPNPPSPFFAAMEEAGLDLVQGSLWLFPLGSDNPPERLRHQSRQRGAKSYWMYGLFAPKAS